MGKDDRLILVKINSIQQTQRETNIFIEPLIFPCIKYLMTLFFDFDFINSIRAKEKKNQQQPND